jgi:uncharacterized protein YidB (DUF937 family)
MGLLDVLNGMQDGPRGQRAPAPAGRSGGMSPATMAVMGLLAHKAMKHLGGGQPSPAPTGPGSASASGSHGGSLSDLLSSGLGGLLGGGTAGTTVSSGLNDLLKQFQEKGHGDVANSWVSNEPNKQIPPDTLSKVLSEDQIKTLTQLTGMSADDLIKTLSEHLPNAVNQLTPEGRLPTQQEASRLL